MIVYVIFSPSTTYANLFSVTDVFVAEIIDFTYVCVVSPVGTSFTVAVFLIGVLSSWSFTVTLNSTVFVSPASKCTWIPLARVSSVSAVVWFPTFTLPVTNVVPAGTVSFTVTSAGAVPLLLSNVIIYVISCPATTLLPLAGSAVFVNLTSDLFTVSVTSSVGVPSTVAVFVITFVNPSVNSSTVTSKLKAVSPYAGTFTVIPLAKSSSPKLAVSGLLLILMLPSTKLVPSGISSVIWTSSAKPPSFLTVIVYVIFSPSTT